MLDLSDLLDFCLARGTPFSLVCFAEKSFKFYKIFLYLFDLVDLSDFCALAHSYCVHIVFFLFDLSDLLDFCPERGTPLFKFKTQKYEKNSSPLNDEPEFLFAFGNYFLTIVLSLST